MTQEDTQTVNPRSAARLAAVQALYQWDMADDVQAAQIVKEYARHRLGQEIDGDLYAGADEDFFADIVKGAVERLEEIDSLIAANLSKNWSLARLEKILKSILRLGVYELLARPDIPTAVIIDEYVDVAHAFYADQEPGFVNGVLDRLARELRQ